MNYFVTETFKDWLMHCFRHYIGKHMRRGTVFHGNNAVLDAVPDKMVSDVDMSCPALTDRVVDNVYTRLVVLIYFHW